MQNEIKSVELILENCEGIEIEGKHIGTFNVSDIKYSICRVACNYIDRMKTCNHFSISINRESNILYNPFDQEEWRMKKFDRVIQHRDITSISIIYSDDSKENFYIKWSGDSEYTNECQYTYQNDSGDLFIVIDEDKKLEDIFEIEDINSVSYMEHIWRMYD